MDGGNVHQRHQGATEGKGRVTTCVLMSRWFSGQGEAGPGSKTPFGLTSLPQAKQLRADRPVLLGPHQLWRQHKLQHSDPQSYFMQFVIKWFTHRNPEQHAALNMSHLLKSVAPLLERQFNCNGIGDNIGWYKEQKP